MRPHSVSSRLYDVAASSCGANAGEIRHAIGHLLVRLTIPCNRIHLLKEVASNSDRIFRELAHAHGRISLSSTIGVQLHRDLPYDSISTACRLHLCVPQDAPDAPLVVYIHGGGWTGGSLEQYLPHIQRIAAEGFAAASVEYRLVPEACFPEILYDVARACAWLKANASRYGFDGRRAMTAGSSAGGHLALLLAARGGELAASGICGAVPTFVAAVGQCPATTLEQIEGDGVLEFRRQARGNCPLAECSPVHIDPEKFPPLEIHHGTDDTTIPLDESRRFVERLSQAGRECELVVLPGIPHAFGYNLSKEPGELSFKRTLAFARRHLVG
jgi:acetyl esterase/lipase